ncbi:MAG: serine/threonine protein kinase [Planctomycetes bacterium]|nr:serine/threonine protein kinase [Planctomycetota bacterium]
MLRPGQKLGKYKIKSRISNGPYATVYRAHDTIEGVNVALKIPHKGLVTKELLEDFSREARLAAKLDHPNILGLKSADFIDGHLVIAFRLGDESLDERLQRRLSLRTAIDLGEQLLRAVAFAHENRVIHCDVKPDNLLLFPDGRLRLTDFGISKVAQRTISGSGAGTVGYMAPEQAMGRPSRRSDVFATGIVLWQMFSGQLPEWPFEWPPQGYSKLKAVLHADMITVLKRAMELKPSHRFDDAGQMLSAYLRAKPKAMLQAERRKRTRKSKAPTKRHWKEFRQQQFLREFGKHLTANLKCNRCEGPVSEFMHACPWCGTSRKRLRDETSFPACCPRCHRGRKLDWLYCAWCYGPRFEEVAVRRYTDLRYVARCRNPKCRREDLMPFMRYCPWCRTKVRLPWKIPGSTDTCHKCGWGVLRDFWSHCPWCAATL